jgi:hypothetical protein
MGWAETIGGVLSTGVTGGLSGVFGAGVTAYFKIKQQKIELENRKLDNEHELAMADKHLAQQQAETDGAVKIEEARADIEETKAEGKALAQSFKMASKNLFDKSYMEKLPPWIQGAIAMGFAAMDLLKASVRPITTYILLWATLFISYKTYQESPEAFVASATLLVETIIYLTVTCLTWWYCDRRMGKFLMSKSR